ncbi:MAG: hypothetical protein HY260_11810 [Chloroflexi bacterium]|nr:hypothetical protein [Chloroflexota bacterium]
MNGRQRVLRVLRGEPVDRVPRGEVRLDDEFVRALMGFRRRRAVIGRVEQNATIAALNLDLITIDAGTAAQGLSAEVDKAQLHGVGEWRGSGLAVFVRVDGPFNRLVAGLGPEETRHWLDGLRKSPFSPPEMAAAQTRRAMDRAAGAGADAVLIADDHRQITPELASPEQVRRYYLPALQMSIRSARAHRLPVFLHLADWLWPALDELASPVPDGLQGLAGVPLDEVRARVSPAICLWGNVAPEWLAGPRSSDEIEAEARRLLLAGGSRYLFGTASGLRGDMNVQTVLSLFDAVASVSAAPDVGI